MAGRRRVEFTRVSFPFGRSFANTYTRKSFPLTNLSNSEIQAELFMTEMQFKVDAPPRNGVMTLDGELWTLKSANGPKS